MANPYIGFRADPPLAQRLEAYMRRETERTGVQVVRAEVLRAALEAWLANKETYAQSEQKTLG